MTRRLCTAVFALTVLGASHAEAANRDFCHAYAQAALVQVRAAINLPRCAERFDPGPRWSTDAHVHFNWCRGVAETTANDERDARKDFIDRCRHW